VTPTLRQTEPNETSAQPPSLPLIAHVPGKYIGSTRLAYEILLVKTLSGENHCATPSLFARSSASLRLRQY
jgi:hypothetical protein